MRLLVNALVATGQAEAIGRVVKLAVVPFSVLLVAVFSAADTAAESVGAPSRTLCRDVVDGGSVVMGMCINPPAPGRALAVGAVLPALAVALLATLWHRRMGGRPAAAPVAST